MVDSAAVIRAARARLVRYGWIKNFWKHGNECCMHFAIQLELRAATGSTLEGPETWPTWNRVWDALPAWAKRSCVYFNDNPRTELKDVLAVLDAAAGTVDGAA